MSQIEQETTRFLKRIMWSISLGLVWLFSNFGIAFYNDWVVPHGRVRLANILFYIFAVISTAVMIWLNYRIWKEKFPHG